MIRLIFHGITLFGETKLKLFRIIEVRILIEKHYSETIINITKADKDLL